MITGRIPFRAQDKYALLHKIASGTVEITYPPTFPKPFQVIIESCLRFEPSHRIAAPQLLNHVRSLPALLSDSALSTPISKDKVADCSDFSSHLVSEHSSTILSLHELNSSQKATTTS